MLASDIINRARVVLNDGDSVRWLDPEMMQWLTDGQRTIVLVRPDASVSNEVLTLVAGTQQAIPPTYGYRLLDVVRNVSSSGPPVVGGRSIRYIDREVMDSQNTAWHSGTPSSTVTNFIFDNRDPKHFYVFPPATAGAKIEIIISRSPTDVTTTGQTLDLSDIYADPLLNYVLFRAYSKDAEFAQNAQLASSYLQVFMSMLGVKSKKDAAYSPDLNSKGALPNATALQMEGV